VAAASPPKNLYQHKRPFQVDDAHVCVSAKGRAALERSPDYPSGHTALGWEMGSVLAELAPDAATEILARARAFGQSRVVCGVHNYSAVEAGWLTSSAIFTAQQSSAEFRDDLEAAKAELAALRGKAATKPEGCALDAQTLSKNPY
jgi:acid phosphatase (class A)